MELNVPYSELSGLIKAKTGKDLLLSCAGPKTVTVGYDAKFKIPLLGEKTKSISIDATIDSIYGNDVRLVLSTGASLLVAGALNFVEENKICQRDGEGFIVHLDQIGQLKSTLEKIRLQDLGFEVDSLKLIFTLT